MADNPKDPQAELQSTLAIDQVLVKAGTVLAETSYWDGDHLKITDVERFNKAKAEIEAIFQAYQQELEKTLIALAWMYDQYCGDNFGHNFMGAGEDAIEILENHGLGDERKGIDHTALTELERKIGELNG